MMSIYQRRNHIHIHIHVHVYSRSRSRIYIRSPGDVVCSA